MQLPSKKLELMQRFDQELKAFDQEVSLESTQTFIPRQSGSLEWRESRGETGEKDVMGMMAGYSQVEKSSVVKNKLHEI